MSNAQSIEHAVRRVKDQESFIQGLLVDALEWPINANATEVEDITFEWSAEELRTQELDQQIVEGTIRQIQPFPGNPWGIFLLEFRNPEVFTTNRGMTGTLRRVLRGLVPSKRKSSTLASFHRENLLFICNHDYKHFRFAHFKSPKKKSQSEPLAAFGWGPNDPIRTLCEFNLNSLRWPNVDNEDDWLQNWSEAFDVEKVTERFYRDYADVFAKVEQEVGKANDLFGDDLRIVTQTLFNRLMFLRFIERKQWLEFNGRHDYLQAIFEAGNLGQKSIFQGRLKPLFFEGLAIEGKQRSKVFGNVPFLNGGLFEESQLDESVKDVPNHALEPVLGKDGLFYRYNFTVQESTPLEIEVAVDPEMLGKVFEELVTGRHESGSYYTPRPIVSYMCREALKGVLIDRTGASESAIASLVDDHTIGRLSQTNAKAVLNALDQLKAVDPACGSGAYLLGLLHEMIAIYRELFNEKLQSDARSVYEIKLDIITKNLYGVDIDPFATNIAKLRLWLSLAVEADNPVPLPNLDFKIETGDSLRSENPQHPYDFFHSELQAKSEVVSRLKREFISAHGAEKKQLRKQIEKLESELNDALKEQYGADEVLDWRLQFAEVFSPGRNGFDIVVANPPYVRQELITESKPRLQRNFPDVYAGVADLYVYFYARGIELLRPKGMLAFIAPNKFFRSGYGEKLRKYLPARTCIQTVIDFADYPIFQAITYPSVIVTRNGRCSSNNNTFQGVNWGRRDSPDNIVEIMKNASAVSSRDLLAKEAWRLISPKISDLLKKIRGSHPILGETCELFYGIKTGANEVFEIDQATRDHMVSEDERSAEIIRPWLRGRNVARWDVNWGGQYLIFTRRGIDIDRYPVVKQYLETNRVRLEPKPRNFSGRSWQGRKPGSYKWFEIQDAIDYWERFDEPKIMYQVIATYQQFAYTSKPFVSNDKTWIIPSPPEGLIGILNSKVAWLFLDQIVPKLQGGAFELRSPFMQQLPIARPTNDLIARVKSILSTDQTTGDGKNRVIQLENEIDEIVLKLYGLSKEDEKLIDETLSQSDNRFPRTFRESNEYQQYVAEMFDE